MTSCNGGHRDVKRGMVFYEGIESFGETIRTQQKNARRVDGSGASPGQRLKRIWEKGKISL